MKTADKNCALVLERSHYTTSDLMMSYFIFLSTVSRPINTTPCQQVFSAQTCYHCLKNAQMCYENNKTNTGHVWTYLNALHSVIPYSSYIYRIHNLSNILIEFVKIIDLHVLSSALISPRGIC